MADLALIDYERECDLILKNIVKLIFEEFETKEEIEDLIDMVESARELNKNQKKLISIICKNVIARKHS